MRSEKQRVLTVKIEDCTVQTFRSGGKGGQNQNKRDTGVRVIHPPSGARGEARDERTQLGNKRLAFSRMAEDPLFAQWVRVRTAEITGSLERTVNSLMHPNNLKIETYDPEAKSR